MIEANVFTVGVLLVFSNGNSVYVSNNDTQKIKMLSDFVEKGGKINVIV